MTERLFPEHGWAWEDVRESLEAYKADDIDWMHGRAPMYVFYVDEDLHEVVKQAFNLYFSENALGAKAFPSLVRLEREVIRMACDILGGGPDATDSPNIITV